MDCHSQGFKVPRVPPISPLLSLANVENLSYGDNDGSNTNIKEKLPMEEVNNIFNNNKNNDKKTEDQANGANHGGFDVVSGSSCTAAIENNTKGSCNIIRINEINNQNEKEKEKNHPDSSSAGSEKHEGPAGKLGKLCPSCSKILMEAFLLPMESYMRDVWRQIGTTQSFETFRQFPNRQTEIINSNQLVDSSQIRNQRQKHNHSIVSSFSTSNKSFGGNNLFSQGIANVEHHREGLEQEVGQRKELKPEVEQPEEEFASELFDLQTRLSRRRHHQLNFDDIPGLVTDENDKDNEDGGSNQTKATTAAAADAVDEFISVKSINFHSDISNNINNNTVTAVESDNWPNHYNSNMGENIPMIKPDGLWKNNFEAMLAPDAKMKKKVMASCMQQNGWLKFERKEKMELRKYDPEKPDQTSHFSSFAYATIIQTNLDAFNALILANSLHYYDNHQLAMPVSEKPKSEIRHQRIPLVALVDQQGVDAGLAHLIAQLYDRVERLDSTDLALLNDESFGIRHVKVQLWKRLAAMGCRKCLYLNPAILVVGRISNLFLECQELSASVHCFYPDYFDCSVMVLEPNETTYRDLISFGAQLTMKNEFPDVIDEISLLNEYFSSKWRRLSFIYNYRRNDSSYTQMAAFFRFGDNVRVVNFGGTDGGIQPSGNCARTSPVHAAEPWNYKFELTDVSNRENQFRMDAGIDNYCQFYLLLFVRRVWPLLASRMVPLLASAIGPSANSEYRLWSVWELAQIIERQPNWSTKHTVWKSPSSPCSILDRIVPTGLKNETTEPPEEKLQQQQLDDDDANGQDWERDHIDWMHQYRSDKIIDRLKAKFQPPNVPKF